MKQNKTKRILSLSLSFILVALLAGPNFIMAAQPTVNLGTTASYAVLAGSAITNTGTTIINGDVGGDIGLFPGTAYTGGGTVQLSGTAHITDAAASQAKADLMVAYLDASSRTPITTIPTELGGTTLKPGTYTSSSGTFELTGTLTLDAEGDPEGVFVFITASTLVTASDSNIVLQNSARFCRTFWSVGSSATLGTNSHFVGHIFAMASITATTGATVQGQLLAINGAVTLDSNTITNGICEVAIPPIPVTTVAIPPIPVTTVAATTVQATTVPTTRVPRTVAITVPTTRVPTTTVPITTVSTAKLYVIKHVINDNGGISKASQFDIHVKNSGTNNDVVGSPKEGTEAPGTLYTLLPGKYKVSELGAFGDANGSGYTMSFSGDVDANGNITLKAGESKTIIIINNDKPVVTQSTTIAPQIVTPPVTNVTKVSPTTVTITGGILPITATPWYNLLVGGSLLLVIGVVSLSMKRR